MRRIIGPRNSNRHEARLIALSQSMEKVAEAFISGCRLEITALGDPQDPSFSSTEDNGNGR